MEINVSRRSLEDKPTALLLFDAFNECVKQLNKSVILFEFPIYKNLDGEPVYVQAIVASPEYGLLVFAIDDPAKTDDVILEELDQVVSFIHARLVRNPSLRAGRLQLSLPINYIFFTTAENLAFEDEDIVIIHNSGGLSTLLSDLRLDETLSDEMFAELVSTLDGSKGLLRLKPRALSGDLSSKGHFIKALEDEIVVFDNQQRYGFVIPSDGPQRIRGIAGSGKTVVLAMKAAITHLKFPDAKIIYTFYTKNLYQHVKRLITRFYRQFDDKDPDWDTLRVMHAWGGRSYPGVYHGICIKHGVDPLTYSDRKVEATQKKTTVFDVVCTELKEAVDLKPIYDFVFIDEGQDFPASFIDLCRQVTNRGRIVWAYDELQNIFDIKVPTQEEVFGKNPDDSPVAEIVEDTILYKSYRNPREILTTGHALGFGIYSERIVQMFENKEHWQDIGYQVLEGACTQGEKTIVERPEETSTRTISTNFAFNEIVNCRVFDTVDEEIAYVVDSICEDLNAELRPDDILVAIVDDRNAATYARRIEGELIARDINVNNTHKDKFGIVDFYIDGAVTISTVYKAKGNESYQVYVVGADAIFRSPDILNRNKIFTAITRAKAWVTITGIDQPAEECQKEIGLVAAHFPKLEFIYPSQDYIRIMRRDMTRAARKRQAAERSIDEALKMMSPEEIRKYLGQIEK